MEITKTSPMKIDIGVIPESTIVCELKLKGTKVPIKVNIDIHIYCKHPIHRNMTDVITSGIQSIYTSFNDTIHTIKMKIPSFRDRIQSCVYITIDQNQNPYAKVFIKDIIVEDIHKYEIRQYTKINALKIKMEKFKTQGDHFNIVCEGLMLGNSGFAKAMRNITFELDKIGCNIIAIIRDTDNIRSLRTQKGMRILELSKRENTFEWPYFWITMSYPLAIKPHNDCYSIGYAMFETTTFPDIFAQQLKGQNEIWTPSNFCRNSMIKAGLEKVFVMPLGVDTELFNPTNIEPMKCPNKMKDKYKFLFVSSFNERKGVSILISAFAEEFKRSDDVVLYIKGGSYDVRNAQQEIDSILKNIPNPPYIHLHFGVCPDSTLASLYKMCDCFVLPTRGEGYGLPFIEAMSMGMPTIGTRWGGQLEFMNDDNSYLIDIEGIRPEPKCNWMSHEYIGRSFAVPSKEHLKKLLRHVFEHKDEAKEKGKIAREYVVNNFSWEKSCERIHERLKSIAQGYI